MFDWIKRVIGFTDCRGCRHRRWGGLVCGKRGTFVHLRPTPWGRYGCWHFAADRLGRDQQTELRILRRNRT